MADVWDFASTFAVGLLGAGAAIAGAAIQWKRERDALVKDRDAQHEREAADRARLDAEDRTDRCRALMVELGKAWGDAWLIYSRRTPAPADDADPTNFDYLIDRETWDELRPRAVAMILISRQISLVSRSDETRNAARALIDQLEDYVPPKQGRFDFREVPRFEWVTSAIDALERTLA